MALCLLLSCNLSLTYANVGQPIRLSGPYPALASPMVAGEDTSTYSYTITNLTGIPIGVSQSITGNSSSVIVSRPCQTVPAHGSCNFVVSVTPSIADALDNGNITDTVKVTYNGRLPKQLTSPIHVTVTEPALSSITITPSSSTVLGGSFVPYKAVGVYSNGAVLDITKYVNWSSTNSNVAIFPTKSVFNSHGTAFAVSGGGTGGNASATITATRKAQTSNSATLNVNDYVFIANRVAFTGTTVSSCFLNQAVVTALSLNPCNAQTGAPFPFTGPGNIAVNPAGTIAYVTNTGSQSVSYCSINVNTGALTNCKSTGNGFYQPVGITVSNDNRFAYVSDYNNGLITCPINRTTGALSNCIANNTGIVFPQAIAIHPKQSYVYVSNAGYYIYYCAINLVTGSVSNCLEIDSSANYANALTIHPKGTYLYFAQTGSNNVLYCPIQSNGSLGTCLSANGSNSFNGLIGLSIQPNGTNMYLTTSNTNEVYVCPMNGNILGTCVVQSQPGGTPWGITAR
ncbi:YncE family protein [Legionella sp. km772]|uniref:YncE family protein n=1 Tax=Legionella sp. km772 TaxID=2498111 RepID=UPI00131569E9|nr:beta-propeller fold lactonase family protein [Legionella sp. km772]